MSGCTTLTLQSPQSRTPRVLVAPCCQSLHRTLRTALPRTHTIARLAAYHRVVVVQMQVAPVNVVSAAIIGVLGLVCYLVLSLLPDTESAAALLELRAKRADACAQAQSG